MIPDKILNVFNRSIKMVCSNIACYCNDPVSDFTRKRKLPAETLIHFIVQMQSKSLNSELCEYFTDLDSLPTASALCQQRDKLDISAFQRIMHLFVNAFDDYKTWKGYHVLACDGSDVNIAYDEKDEDTKRQNGNNKPFSQLHINGLYDCINHVFWDTSIDTATKTRECAALMKMIMRHDYPVNSIITADRGYEKYNLMACCIENNQKFVFRIKDYLAILLIILALFILFRGILAFMFSHISELKGYHGLSEWFLVFFLGIYGVLYVWMLPYKAEDEVEEENESIDIQA